VNVLIAKKMCLVGLASSHAGPHGTISTVSPRSYQLFALLIFPYLWHFTGYNVNHRKRKSGTVGFQHRLTKEDAMKWFQQKYDGIILNTKK